MKAYSSYPNKKESSLDHVTNEDLLSNFEQRIEGIGKRIDNVEKVFKESIKEYIETCNKMCLMKVERVNEKTNDTASRIHTVESAVQEIKQILREIEGSRKMFNWLMGIVVAILTLLLLYMDLKR